MTPLANRSIAPDHETQGAPPTGPTGVVHRGAGPVPRSTRTREQVESNRAFMAAAGRVRFGRHEATLRGVWIAICLFASLGPERICYAAVERKREDEDEDKPGIAERAKVSGRTVRRHFPALIDRGLIEAENRAGGRTPTTWKVTLPDDTQIAPTRTECPARADRVSDDLKDRGSSSGPRPKGASAPQKRDGKKLRHRSGHDGSALEGLACSLCRARNGRTSTTPRRGHAEGRRTGEHHGTNPRRPRRRRRRRHDETTHPL